MLDQPWVNVRTGLAEGIVDPSVGERGGGESAVKDEENERPCEVWFRLPLV